ncbi:autotransporter assembly complex protein TamA [Marinibacterium sp. SX1]|uniref:autotransporter assembly complex protein TamA n=1 Tax=Marinibacterium sp. SX1 TaxID=3388424 RepID=UPI003D1707EE
MKTIFRNERRFGRAMAIGLMTATVPGLAAAFDAQLSMTDGPEKLEKRLSAASLAMSLSRDDDTRHTSSEILAAARADYGTLISLLYDAGYFGPEIHIYVDGREAADIAPLNAPETITKIDIQVTPGRLFTFGRADIGPLAPDTTLPESFRSGQPAQTSAIRSAAITSINEWRDDGHAKADISDQTIVADHPEAVLDVEVELQPGPRLDFGQLTVKGNQDVRTDAILRIAGYPEGEQFDPEELDKVRSRLRRTGAFSSVAVQEADTPNADDTLDIGITVGEQLKRRFSFGIEIESDDGITLSGEWIHRNLFGGAERLKIEAETGTDYSDGGFDGKLTFRLDMPAYFGTDNDLFYFGGIEYLDEPHYDAVNLYGGAGIRRVFSEDLTGEVSIGPFFSQVDDAYGSDRKFQAVRLPSRLEWDKRDDPVNATKGFYLRTNVTPYAGFGETQAGVSALVDGRTYLAVTDSIVLAGRAQVGSVLGSSLTGTTPDLLFFSGGADTVRGQPYESLGIPVGTDTAGGKSFLGLSAEVRTRVTSAITLVGFYDYGMVGPDSFVTADDESQSGAGLGLRYGLSGIGAIRVDVAYPVHGDTSDGLQFYIGIGQAF